MSAHLTFACLVGLVRSVDWIFSSNNLLANRSQKARVEVVEEVMSKMPVKVLGEDRELQDENQDENPKEGGGSQKFGKRAVIFKKREPKRMSYLDALMKSKTENGDHDQNTIKSKIGKLGWIICLE